MTHPSRRLIIAVIVLLGLLVIIQFLWIYRAARMQEKQFESVVILAMNKAVEQLAEQKEVCSEVAACMMQRNIPSCRKCDLNYQQWNILDSIVVAELAQNRIKIKYELILSTTPHPDCPTSKLHKCFAIKSQIKTMQGEILWLHVAFPGRNAFIAAQIGGLFLVSLILIILTLAVFIRIYAYYKAEWTMARDTRNFINNMTHELKTPVASIKLSNNRIRKTIDSALIPFSNIIEQEANKLDKMANYLLDASKLQRGYLEPVPELTDISSIIQQQVELFNLQVAEKCGTLTFVNNSMNPNVMGDAFQLSIALGNLIDNAIKYSFEEPAITITLRNEKDNLVVEVIDNGIGIDKENQKIIFQEFTRVDTGNLHQVKGFGLGLTFVWHIVKNHKGKLLLESKKGEGSRFIVILPSFIG